MMPLSMTDFDTHKAYLGDMQLGEIWLGEDLLYKAEKLLIGDGINLLGTTYYNITEYGEGAWLNGSGIKEGADGYYQLSAGVANNWGNWAAGFNGKIDSEDYDTLMFTYTVTQMKNIAHIYVNGVEITNSTLNEEISEPIPVNKNSPVSLYFASSCHKDSYVNIIFKVTLE